jgi:hypothetical protein
LLDADANSDYVGQAAATRVMRRRADLAMLWPRRGAAVDAFSYLSVLISIILGIALTQLLTGAGRLIRVRDRVRFYLPAALWMAVLFIIIVQGWWTMFTLRLYTTWTIDRFIVVLLHPTVLYLLVELNMPEAAGEGAIDMKANYFRQAPAFFIALIGLLVVSMLRPIILDGHFAEPLDIIFHLAFTVFAVVAASWRNDAFHRITAPAVLIMLFVYIALLFTMLR